MNQFSDSNVLVLLGCIPEFGMRKSVKINLNLWNISAIDSEEVTKPSPLLTHKSSKSLPMNLRSLTLELPPETAPPSTPPQVSPMSSLERGRKSVHKKGLTVGPEIKVLIVWLETFDDREAFPLSEYRRRTLSLFVCLSVCLFVCLSVCLFVFCLFVCLFLLSRELRKRIRAYWLKR